MNHENPTLESTQAAQTTRSVREKVDFTVFACPNPRATVLATFSTPFAWHGGWEYIDELHSNEWGMWQGVRLSDCRMGWARIAVKPVVQVVQIDHQVTDQDWPARSPLFEVEDEPAKGVKVHLHRLGKVILPIQGSLDELFVDE